jgi:hypothetical protein
MEPYLIIQTTEQHTSEARNQGTSKIFILDTAHISENISIEVQNITFMLLQCILFNKCLLHAKICTHK